VAWRRWQRVLEIGAAAPAGQLYARAAARPCGRHPTRLVDELQKGLGALRAKRLLDISYYDVDGFDVQAGDAKRTYARSTTKDKDGIETFKWRRTAPDTKELDANTVQNALFKIGDVNASAFVDRPGRPRPTSGSAILRLSLRLTAAAGGAATWIEVGQKDGAISPGAERLCHPGSRRDQGGGAGQGADRALSASRLRPDPSLACQANAHCEETPPHDSGRSFGP